MLRASLSLCLLAGLLAVSCGGEDALPAPKKAAGSGGASAAKAPSLHALGRWGAGNDAEGLGLALSGEGFLVIAGRVKNPVDFGFGPIFPLDNTHDGFLIGLSLETLQAKGAVTTKAKGEQEWTAVTALSDGQIVAVGTEREDEVTNAAISVKLSWRAVDSGLETRMKTLTSTGGVVTASSMVALPGGDFAIAGVLSGIVNADGVKAKRAASGDPFVMRLSPEGVARWASVEPGASADPAVSLALDAASGDVVIVGTRGLPDKQLYLARIRAADGAKRWGALLGQPGQSVVGRRALVQGEAIHVVGSVSGKAKLAVGVELVPPSGGAGFLATFSLGSGAPVAAFIPKPEAAELTGIADDKGKLLVCGGGCAFFDPASRTLAGALAGSLGEALVISGDRVVTFGTDKPDVSTIQPAVAVFGP